MRPFKNNQKSNLFEKKSFVITGSFIDIKRNELEILLKENGGKVTNKISNKSKKFAVLAKQGSQVKLIRFGDPNMSIKKDDPKRRKSFRARHRCDSSPPSKLSARYWSCKKW